MPFRRLAATAFISAATVALGVAIGPASIAMAADIITVSYAGSPASNPGLLTIDIQSTTSITSLTAQLVPTAGSPVSVSNLQLISGTDTSGEWQVPSALTLPALGAYTVQVSAADSFGTSVSNPDAGTLYYVTQVALTAGISPSSVNWDNRAATVTGQAVGTNPDGSSQSLAGVPVNIVDASDTSQVAATGTIANDGSYQVPFNPVPQTAYEAVIAASSTMATASSNPFSVTSVLDPVTLTATVSATRVKLGSSVTITGKATYQPAGQSAFVPLADSTIAIYPIDASSSGYVPTTTTTTASDGTFSVSVKMTQTQQFHVYAGGLPSANPILVDYFFQQAEVILPEVTAALPVKLSQFSAKVSPFRVLTVRGCLAIYHLQTLELPLQIQYSAHASGPWTKLKNLTSSVTTTRCSGGAAGRIFTGTGRVQLASAYYRVVYLGSQQFEAASTKAILVWKYVTKITSLKVSATHVARGGHLTVSGQLWQYTRAWHTYAKRRVLIVLRPKGSRNWYWIVKVLTNSTGHFRARFTDPVSATWSAVYEGDSTHYASGAKLMIYVSVGAGLPGAVQLPLLGGPAANGVGAGTSVRTAR